MSRKNFNDLFAFMVIAKEGSFTKAAAQLGVSPSALSHNLKSLESRLGVQLMTRTTRSISPTAAGDQLLKTLETSFSDIEESLTNLGELRDKPAGTIRITTAEHAALTILWPKLSTFLPDYPDIKVEINIDYGFTDIVSQRYDAGVRLGESVEKDMIAARIGPDLKMAVVASPSYFSTHEKPRTPHDLARHNCINLRLPTHDGLMIWDLEKKGQTLKIRVDGQLVFNSGTQILKATLEGFGLAYLPDGMVKEAVAKGTLISVLEDWCPPFPGYYLYYPSRHHPSPAFSLLLEALRHRE